MPTSLRDVVAQVEAEWTQERESSSNDDYGDDASSEHDAPPSVLPVTKLANAPVTVKRGHPLSVLLLHGLFSSTSWFLDALIGRPLSTEITAGMTKRDQEEDRAVVLHAWNGVQVHRRNFAHAEDADAIASCQRAIASGDYHAIVLVDLSARELLPAFEAHLGPLLRAFVECGGSVGFTTTEGLLLPPTLGRLFGTAWKPGAYYRAAWEPASHHIAQHLDGAGHMYEPSAPLRAKACCLTSVPSSERLFAVPRCRRPPASISQRVVCPDTTDTADTSTYTSDDADDNPDVCVAVHTIGRGRIGFFGDAFCTARGVALLAAFCRATATLHEACLVGKRVVVRDLQSEPGHNGAIGTVLRPQGTDQWQVRLEEDACTELALRAANLTVVEDEGQRGSNTTDGVAGVDGDRGQASASSCRARSSQVTYSPIRLLLGMMRGTPPDGRGDIFREAWMNFAAVGAACIALGLAIGAAAMAAVGHGVEPKPEPHQLEVDLDSIEYTDLHRST